MADTHQTDRAYEAIRRRILTLEIRPGERIREEQWARKINLGRLAVREALTRLHGEGLVVRGLKGGFLAAAMTLSEVHEIREMREIIEVAALRLAVKRVTPDQLAELEVTCDDFAFMARKGYHTGAAEADRRFHHLLVSASANKRLLRAYEHCHLPLFQVRNAQSDEYQENYDDTEREHRGIVTAVKAGDVETAVDLLRSQFERGEREFIASISEPAQAIPAAS